MFSSTNNSCGSKCIDKTTRAKRDANEDESKLRGWTSFYNSDDNPSGTGDHEHYLYYRNSKRDKLKVYGKDGTEFTGCKKTALYVREMETQARDFNMTVNWQISSLQGSSRSCFASLITRKSFMVGEVKELHYIIFSFNRLWR